MSERLSRKLIFSLGHWKRCIYIYLQGQRPIGWPWPTYICLAPLVALSIYFLFLFFMGLAVSVASLSCYSVAVGVLYCLLCESGALYLRQDSPVLGLYSSAFLKGLAHDECCCVPPKTGSGWCPLVAALCHPSASFQSILTKANQTQAASAVAQGADLFWDSLTLALFKDYG